MCQIYLESNLLEHPPKFKPRSQLIKNVHFQTTHPRKFFSIKQKILSNCNLKLKLEKENINYETLQIPIFSCMKKFFYRWFFWRMEWNCSPNSHQKIWRTNGLRTVVFLMVINDIHEVLWVNADPVDVRNDFQQDTYLQAISSSNFLMWVLGVISFHSSKKSHSTLESLLNGNKSL